MEDHIDRQIFSSIREYNAEKNKTTTIIAHIIKPVIIFDIFHPQWNKHWAQKIRYTGITGKTYVCMYSSYMK